MINIGKKLFNVAFQDPASFGIVFTNNIRVFAEFIDSFMRAFFVSARIGIGNESFIEKWIKNSVNGVMQQAISHAGFVDVSGFWIIAFESLITAVIIGMMEKIAVQWKNIIH